MQPSSIESAIVEALAGCFSVQRTFGKKLEDLPVMAKIWLKTIPEKWHNHIPAAILQHMRQSSEFPAPCDILAILDPQPKLDACMYREMLRRKNLGEHSYEIGLYIELYEQRAREAAFPKIGKRLQSPKDARRQNICKELDYGAKSCEKS